MDDVSLRIYALSYGFITAANTTTIVSKLQRGNYNILPEITYNLTWALGLNMLTQIDPLGERLLNFRTIGAFSAGGYEIIESLKRIQKNTKAIQRKKRADKSINARKLEDRISLKGNAGLEYE